MSGRLEKRLFLLLLAAITLLFLYLLKPFFGPIFWACAIAVLFAPVQGRFLKLTRCRRNLASAMTMTVALAICVVPLIFLVRAFYSEGRDLFEAVSSGRIDFKAYLAAINQRVPAAQEFLTRINVSPDQITSYIYKAADVAARTLSGKAIGIVSGTVQFVGSMALMLYVLFFMLRDGPRLVNLLMRALPLGDERESILFTRFADVTRATIKGTMVVAAVQGALGGLIFWILGIHGPVLWGVVMALLSLIPVVGTGLVWAPVAIYLLVTPMWWKGLILLAYGVLVIGLADNLLRPILVGRETRMPDYLVLLSTLGGVAAFGMNGFIIGPLVAALFIAFWDIFSRDFAAKS